MKLGLGVYGPQIRKHPGLNPTPLLGKIQKCIILENTAVYFHIDVQKRRFHLYTLYIGKITPKSPKMV